MRRAAILLLVPLLLAGASAQRGDQPFNTLEGEAAFTLHAGGGPLTIKVWVHTGHTDGLRVDGPGACADREFPAGTNFSPSSGGSTQTFDCGEVGAGPHPLTLRGGAVSDGSIGLEGGGWQPLPEAEETNSPEAIPPTPDPLGGAGWAALALLLTPLLAGRWLLLRLFSRTPHHRVLEHPVRRRLEAEVRTHPGQQRATLRKSLGLARGTLRHHLLVLEAHDLVRRTRRGKRWVYLPGDMDPARFVDHKLLEGTPGRILATATDPCDVLFLTARLGTAHSTTHRWVRRLEEAGLLEVRPGPPRVVAATRRARDLLDCKKGPRSF